MAVLNHYYAFNSRRYTKPWVATIKDGKYDFSKEVGYYTGNTSRGVGEPGDLIVTNPQEGIIYAYGQKDTRKGNSNIAYATWDGKNFNACDKAGRMIIE